MDIEYYDNVYLIENFSVNSYPLGHKCKKNSDCASSFCSANNECKISNAISQKAKEDAIKKQQKRRKRSRNNPIITTMPIIDEESNVDTIPVITEIPILTEININNATLPIIINSDDEEDDDEEDPPESGKKKKKKKKGRGKKKKNKNLPWIIALCIFCLACLIGIGLYYNMKNRNNTQIQPLPPTATTTPG
jgi:hypothetical protein